MQEFEGKAPDGRRPRRRAIPPDRPPAIQQIGERPRELFQVIQTVDSAKLARRLDAAGRALDVMLEVKLSEEDAKSGADPAELPA